MVPMAQSSTQRAIHGMRMTAEASVVLPFGRLRTGRVMLRPFPSDLLHALEDRAAMYVPNDQVDAWVEAVLPEVCLPSVSSRAPPTDRQDDLEDLVADEAEHAARGEPGH